MHVGTREQDVKLGDKRVATGNFARISTVDIIFFFFTRVQLEKMT